MPSRVRDFASCISSRSVFIDQPATFSLRPILCFRPLRLQPEFDQAADGFGTAGYIRLASSLSIGKRNRQRIASHARGLRR
jgi:hypothetical protein